MAHIIFGRGDSDGVVRQSGLLFLLAMLYNVNLDTWSHMMRYFAKVGKTPFGRYYYWRIDYLHYPISKL